jgi:hypothetical protein
MLYHDRIEIDPAVCSGKPVIRGTRILVTSILSQLAAGESFDAVRKVFPDLPTMTSRLPSSSQKNPSRRQNSPLNAIDAPAFH